MLKKLESQGKAYSDTCPMCCGDLDWSQHAGGQSVVCHYCRYVFEKVNSSKVDGPIVQLLSSDSEETVLHAS